MRPRQFTLTAVKPTGAGTVRLRYADGETFEVDLAGIIERHPALARLRDPKVFATAKRGDHGASVVWAEGDELELAADNLRARAVEQLGGVPHDYIWNWMARHQLTLDAAAEALGVSRRMLAYYRSGAKPVPRTVALACLGWEKASKAGEQAVALAA